MHKLLFALPLLGLAACTGTPAEQLAQCANARKAEAAAVAVATQINLTPEHQAWANTAAAAATALVDALCPLP